MLALKAFPLNDEMRSHFLQAGSDGDRVGAARPPLGRWASRSAARTGRLEQGGCLMRVHALHALHAVEAAGLSHRAGAKWASASALGSRR